MRHTGYARTDVVENTKRGWPSQLSGFAHSGRDQTCRSKEVSGLGCYSMILR